MNAKSWRDYQPEKAPPGPCDNSDKRDDSPETEAPPPPNVSNVANVTALPAEVRRGLTYLANAPAPRVRCPDIWPEVIADALRLASEGWAARALALGWSPLDLFGAIPQAGGDPEGDGLAVKLRGRQVLALCASFAIVGEGNCERAFLYRPNNPAAVPLWNLGRGR